MINRPDLRYISPGWEADVAVFSLRKGILDIQTCAETELTALKSWKRSLHSGRVVWDHMKPGASHWTNAGN